MPQAAPYILAFWVLMATVRYIARKAMIRHYSRLPDQKQVALVTNLARMVRFYVLLFKFSPVILAAGLLLTVLVNAVSLLSATLVLIIAYLFIIEDYFFRRAILAGLDQIGGKYDSRTDS